MVITLLPFFGSRFPYKVTNPKKGTLIIMLLGYQVLEYTRLLKGPLLWHILIEAPDYKAP